MVVAIVVGIKVKEQDHHTNQTRAPKGIGQVKGDTVRVTLTEDQLAAWRKVRNEHTGRPVRVLGCLSRSHGRQTFDDGDWGENGWRTMALRGEAIKDWEREDCWHFAFGEGTIYISGNRMGEEVFWADGKELGSSYHEQSFNLKYEESSEFKDSEDRFHKEEVRIGVEKEKTGRKSMKCARGQTDTCLVLVMTKVKENTRGRNRLAAKRGMI